MHSRKNVRILYAILIMLLICTIALNSTGCGYATAMRNACHLDTQTCDNLFGQNNWEIADRLAAADKNIADLSMQITSMQSMISLLVSDSAGYSAQVADLANLLNTLQLTLTDNKAFLDTVTTDLQAEIAQISERVDRQQTIISDLVGDIVELQTQDSVVEYILPCDDRNGIFDEVIMRTQSGKLVAYFEDGGARFLTLLSPGAYQTTDKTPRCNFTVDANNNITNASR